MEELIKPEPSQAFESQPEPEEQTSAEPAEAERPLNTTRVETHHVRPSLLRLIAWIIGIIIIVILIVLGARWLYHKTHHTITPAPASSQKTSLNSSQAKSSGAQPAANSPSSLASNSSSTSTKSNSQISNTGPGNVAAVFALSSLAAGGLHYFISWRRRAN